MNLSESGGILKFAVDLIFVTKLRAASTMLFELDSNLSGIKRTWGAVSNVD
jgi:hypothetical protein